MEGHVVENGIFLVFICIGYIFKVNGIGHLGTSPLEVLKKDGKKLMELGLWIPEVSELAYSLAEDGFNFKEWYEAGYWEEVYIPYSLFEL